MTTQEKLVICASTKLPETVAPGICSQPVCAALVFHSVGTSPAPSRLASNGTRIVAGTAKVVPCGVSANIAPMSAAPGGSVGAPPPPCATVTEVAWFSAPAGTTSCEPPGPSSVAPAAAMLIVVLRRRLVVGAAAGHDQKASRARQGLRWRCAANRVE